MAARSRDRPRAALRRRLRARPPTPPEGAQPGAWAQEALHLALAATVAEGHNEAKALEFALAAQNLATGVPAGVVRLGHTFARARRFHEDPEAKARLDAARQRLFERLAPGAARLEKSGFIFRFGHEVVPVKVALSRPPTIPGDAKMLDRRLAAHLERYPAKTSAPGAGDPTDEGRPRTRR